MIKVSIAENLEDVEKRISAAAKRSGRKREDITLVAVTKTHPAEMMNEAIKLGVTDIGENKPQEVRDKAEKHNLDMDILIQVNISGEETKSGISKEEVEDLLKYAGKLKHVKVKGLMTIAPKTDNSVTNRLHFDNMRQLFVDIKQKKYDNVNMVYLSMGMSGDFETAIECGANMVRVGSAIFGARDYSQNK